TRLHLDCFFFFFQAEDGIRDFHVTGVQTCALPIYFTDPLTWSHNRVEGKQEYTSLLYIPAQAPWDMWNRDHKHGLKLYVQRVFKIGRASCRERVESAVVGEGGEKGREDGGERGRIE